MLNMFNNKKYSNKNKFYSTVAEPGIPTLSPIIGKKSVLQRLTSTVRSRPFLSVYLGTVLASYLYNTYKDGCNALFVYRFTRQVMIRVEPAEIIKPIGVIKNEEFNAVAEACKDPYCNRLLASLTFPVTMIKSIIPYAVILFNGDH